MAVPLCTLCQCITDADYTLQFATSVFLVRMLAGGVGRIMGLGGFFGGSFYDRNGDYKMSFAFASRMGLLNFIVLTAFYTRAKGQRISVSPQQA